MMRRTPLPVVTLLAGLLVLGGCSYLAPAQYYQLDSGAPALSDRSRGVAVLVGPLQVADYLKRDTLVQRQDDDSLSMSSRAHWAGNLTDNVGQVLLRQLSAQLDTSRLALYADREGFDPDLQLMVNVTRLDSGPHQPAVLEAQWRLLDAKGQMRDNQVVRLQESHAGSTADQVKAQGLLVQRFARELSDAVKSAETRRLAKKTEPKAAPAEKPESKEIPVVEPIRTRGEVYRF